MKTNIPQVFSDVGIVDKVVYSSKNMIRVYPKSKGVGVQVFIKK